MYEFGSSDAVCLLDLSLPFSDSWFDDLDPFPVDAVTCFGFEPALCPDEDCWMQSKAQESWFELRLLY